MATIKRRGRRRTFREMTLPTIESKIITKPSKKEIAFTIFIWFGFCTMIFYIATEFFKTPQNLTYFITGTIFGIGTGWRSTAIYYTIKQEKLIQKLTAEQL